MMRLRGYVKNETDKWIRFHITNDLDGFHLGGLTLGFAKGPIKLPKVLYGKEITISIPCWMYDANIPYDEMAV